MKRILVVLAVLVPLLALVFACGKKNVVPFVKPNKLPQVALTGRPFGVAPYSYTFSWTAWDNDGEIARTIYAISRPIPYDILNNEDSLKVALASLRWQEADGWKRSVSFDADTLFGFGETPGSPPDTAYHYTYRAEFRKMHLFIVRVIDDRGDTSKVDQNSYVAFSASNIAPKSWILQPISNEYWAIVGNRLNARWAGNDEDATSLSKTPVAYRWKLVPLGPNLSASDALNYRMYTLDTTSTAKWVEVPGTTTSMSQDLDLGNFYLFGVRAIDEAGAVEPLLMKSIGPIQDVGSTLGSPLYRGNCMIVKAQLGAGLPSLTVSEAVFGTKGPDSGLIEWMIEISAGQELTFSWVGDASIYGGEILGYNYALDPVETDPAQDPDHWSGWNRTQTRLRRPLIINSPGTHYFYVKVRDNGYNETTMRIEIRVLAFNPDRAILLIDDYRDLDASPSGKSPFTDVEHNAWWKKILDRSVLQSRYGVDSVYVYKVYGYNPINGQEPGQDPRPVSLTELLRYRAILWNVYARNTGTFLGMAAAGTPEYAPSLVPYLAAGGSLWLFGNGVYKQLEWVPGVGGQNYPILIETSDISFNNLLSNSGNAAKFRIDICGSTNYPPSKQNIHGLVSAIPYTSKKKGALRPYPPLVIDNSKFPALQQLGIGRADGEFPKPHETTPQSLVQAGLDTLYLFGPKSTTSPLSPTRNRYPLGIRCENTGSSGRATKITYRVVVTPFDLYYFNQKQVQDLTFRVLDWFFLRKD
ncbi:MAG: hypothetical protein QME66_11990 [Candidatus Eisenbacteria bacterium]|nr:hypothetical protein [Candidatus Eisenbacteria bacterium]